MYSRWVLFLRLLESSLFFLFCSMILLNYLARKRAESGMVAGITISVAFDALKSSESMEEPLNWLLFNKYLTRGLCRRVTRLDRLLFLEISLANKCVNRSAKVIHICFPQAQDDFGESCRCGPCLEGTAHCDPHSIISLHL